MPTDLPPPAVVLTVPKPVLNFDKLIAAIEQVENGRWGRLSGRPNWTRALWSQYSPLPFSYSAAPNSSREAMRRALADFTKRYLAEDTTPTLWRLAMCWNLGYDGAKKVRRTETDFGSRVANLCEAKTP